MPSQSPERQVRAEWRREIIVPEMRELLTKIVVEQARRAETYKNARAREWVDRIRPRGNVDRAVHAQLSAQQQHEHVVGLIARYDALARELEMWG